MIRHSELYFSFRRNYAIYLLGTLVITLFSLIIGLLSYLFFGSMSQSKLIYNISHGQNIYQLSDQLTDGNSFSSYRQDLGKMNNVVKFYNQLTEAKSFNYIPVTNQFIYTEVFEHAEDFIAGNSKHLDKSLLAIQSVQLNTSAFDFYKLKISSGENIDWESVNPKSNKLPVLLGSAYKDVFQVGDVIRGYLYIHPVNYHVVGFLENNSKVYISGNPEHYLDHSIVIPYPLKLEEITSTDNLEYLSILYFAMINGNLASTEGEAKIIKTFSDISKSSNYSEYILLGQSTFIQKYKVLLSVLATNTRLLTLTLFVFVLTCILIFVNLLNALYKRQRTLHYILNVYGFRDSRYIFTQDAYLLFIPPTVLSCLLFIFFSGRIILPSLLVILLSSTVLFLISKTLCLFRVRNKGTAHIY